MSLLMQFQTSPHCGIFVFKFRRISRVRPKKIVVSGNVAKKVGSVGGSFLVWQWC